MRAEQTAQLKAIMHELETVDMMLSEIMTRAMRLRDQQYRVDCWSPTAEVLDNIFQTIGAAENETATAIEIIEGAPYMK